MKVFSLSNRSAAPPSIEQRDVSVAQTEYRDSHQFYYEENSKKNAFLRKETKLNRLFFFQFICP